MLNYKLQNNLSDFGKGYNFEDEAVVIKEGRRLDIDNDLNDELFSRKKAWADLEREGDEVKANIKGLLRKTPQSTEIENPLLSDVVRVKNQPSQPVYRVPQDIMLEEKHNK